MYTNAHSSFNSNCPKLETIQIEIIDIHSMNSTVSAIKSMGYQHKL